MRLVLLGTTGYHPNDRRQTACLMLPELGIVLDAGTAMYRVGRYLCTDELDIFLTHVHLDHSIGVTFLFDVLFGHSMKHVTVHAAAEKLPAVVDHLLHPDLFPVRPPCTFEPLASQTRLRGGGTLRTLPMMHPGGSLAFRLDWPGHSMAYVTDTTAAADADYVRHIAGVDLLIHECYFRDEMASWAAETGHSCTTPVAQVARAAGVKRLVLVHTNPLDESDDPVDLAAARRVFAASEIGYDGQELEF